MAGVNAGECVSVLWLWDYAIFHSIHVGGKYIYIFMIIFIHTYIHVIYLCLGKGHNDPKSLIIFISSL